MYWRGGKPNYVSVRTLVMDQSQWFPPGGCQSQASHIIHKLPCSVTTRLHHHLWHVKNHSWRVAVTKWQRLFFCYNLSLFIHLSNILTEVQPLLQQEHRMLLADLCVANTEARIHTLLYVTLTNINGHQVTGHVDLAERVAKVTIQILHQFFTSHSSC